MRNLVKIVLLCALLTATSCDSAQEQKPESIGSPYEVLVVSDNPKATEILRDMLSQPVECIDRVEPRFNASFVTRSALTGYIRKHRTIIYVDIDKKYSRVDLAFSHDVFSSPQTYIQLTAPDAELLAESLNVNRSAVLLKIENQEKQRFIAYAKTHNEPSIEQLIEAKFDLELTIPSDFKVRDDQPDFLWLSLEHPLSSLGVVIYSRPFSDKNNLSIESLIAARNKFVSNIPGPSQGSHMTTYEVIDCDSIYINDNFWSRIRGFWDVKGDFMGGIFSNISIVDTLRQRVISADCYLYSPQEPKRNYLRQLEAIQQTVLVK